MEGACFACLGNLFQIVAPLYENAMLERARMIPGNK